MNLSLAEARAQANLVDMEARALFRTQVYPEAHAGQAFTASTVTAWDAAGRHGAVTTGVLPTSPIVPLDHAEAWGDFQQVGAGSLLRNFTQASGYYGIPGPTPPIDAYTSVTIRNRILITNTSNTTAHLELLHITHGTVLTGGIAAFERADAREDLNVTSVDSNGEPIDYSDHSSAHVLSPTSVPRVELIGTWQTQSVPLTTTTPDGNLTLDGVEIQCLQILNMYSLAPGATRTIDVYYEGAYESQVDDGFLGYARTDFSHTANLEYRATDPTTGEINSGVRFDVVGVPAPGLLSTAACWLGGLARRRRRRLHAC